MPKKLKRKKYTFDFYQISSDRDDLFSRTVQECFESAVEDNIPIEQTSYGCTREIYGLHQRAGKSSFAGQLRKIRKSELPEVGEPGQDGKKIALRANEGVIEKNFFVFYEENSILIMHRNENGNSGTHFAQLLSGVFGVRFFATPIIEPDQVENLLNGKIKLRKLSMRIPKPTNPEIYPQNSISATTLNLLNNSSADSIDVSFNIDPKLSSSRGHLSELINNSIRSILSIGATKATIETDENGMIHPIDLIANRVFSTQTVQTNTSFPPNETMYNLAEKSANEKRGVIDAYFSNSHNRII